MTGSKEGFFPAAGTIMLLCVSIISSSNETPSLTAGGGDRSTATNGGYLKSFSPRAFSMSKKVLEAASLSTQSVLQSAVSLPSKSDIYSRKENLEKRKKNKPYSIKLELKVDFNSQSSCRTPGYY